ncbi:glycerophosphodiester phosphodiesterase [Streptomyces viridochromogenes]|uniref:glycerophosphodiester phosphodiesterase n=1 Tax=Streptomyces viridochromogenes TaxID=1938 RepID=UPI000A398BD4|nr:glycerophosphodiester phosphodiesterase family protein [Streptomyces viridochromogenes]
MPSTSPSSTLSPATRARRAPRSRVALLASVLLAVSLPAAAHAEDTDPATDTDAPASRVVLSVDFSGSSLPEGFKAVDGTWQVKNGRLYGTSANSSQQSRITFGKHLTDFRIEVTARFESVVDAGRWTAMGLDLPADGSVPWSIATMRTGTTAANGLEFAQRTAADTWNVTDTHEAPSAADTGKDVKIAAEVHGTKAVWYFDGKEVMRTSNVARSADGVQGLLVNGASASYDDLKVTELPPAGYIRPAGAPLTVIGHRGASSAAPENTLVSQEIARRGGADFIENDVQPSKDGVPYILHDSTVDRTTDGTGPVRSLTSAQLDALDAGSWFAPHYKGARVPTLAAQLDDLRTRRGDLLLEIKGAHTKAEVATIVDTIRTHGMTGRVFVQSFEVDALRYTHELAPDLPLGLLRSTLDADPVALAKELHLAAYNPEDGALSKKPSVIADLHKAGVAVMVWTVDAPDRWKALESAGVDGVITNRPTELSGWNSAFRQSQAQPPAKPAVRFTSPAADAVLDRAQTPVPTVQSEHSASVALTLDGRPVRAGAPLELTTLAAGPHTLRAVASGDGGTAEDTLTFTLKATPTGLAHLIFTSGAKNSAISTMTGMLGLKQYSVLATWAKVQSGKALDKERAALIAEDARALAAAH